MSISNIAIFIANSGEVISNNWMHIHGSNFLPLPDYSLEFLNKKRYGLIIDLNRFGLAGKILYIRVEEDKNELGSV